MEGPFGGREDVGNVRRSMVTGRHEGFGLDCSGGSEEESQESDWRHCGLDYSGSKGGGLECVV